MTNRDYDRIIFTLIASLLAALLIILSARLGEANRKITGLKEQIATMEVNG